VLNKYVQLGIVTYIDVSREPETGTPNFQVDWFCDCLRKGEHQIEILTPSPPPLPGELSNFPRLPDPTGFCPVVSGACGLMTCCIPPRGAVRSGEHAVGDVDWVMMTDQDEMTFPIQEPTAALSTVLARDYKDHACVRMWRYNFGACALPIARLRPTNRRLKAACLSQLNPTRIPEIVMMIWGRPALAGTSYWHRRPADGLMIENYLLRDGIDDGWPKLAINLK
jgi:hypothetical protein